MLSTVPFSTLARETRLRIHLCSLVKRGKNAHSVFAWCNLQLFDFHDRMPRGELRINMWRTDDGVIGTTASSPSPLSPQLVLRFLEPPLIIAFLHPNLDNPSDSLADPLPALASRNADSASDSEEIPAGMPQYLSSICAKDPLTRLADRETDVLWKYRNYVVKRISNSLPKLIRCVRWNDPAMVKTLHEIVDTSPQISTFHALRLLDYRYADMKVRAYAVQCLDSLTDHELILYLLQLVQSVKFEPYLFSSLTRFLLYRALKSPRTVGHALYWHLRAEADPQVSLQYGCIMYGLNLCRSLFDALEKSARLFPNANRLLGCKTHCSRKACRCRSRPFEQNLRRRGFCEHPT